MKHNQNCTRRYTPYIKATKLASDYIFRATLMRPQLMPIFHCPPRSSGKCTKLSPNKWIRDIWVLALLLRQQCDLGWATFLLGFCFLTCKMGLMITVQLASTAVSIKWDDGSKPALYKLEGPDELLRASASPEDEPEELKAWCPSAKPTSPTTGLCPVLRLDTPVRSLSSQEPHWPGAPRSMSRHLHFHSLFSFSLRMTGDPTKWVFQESPKHRAWSHCLQSQAALFLHKGKTWPHGGINHECFWWNLSLNNLKISFQYTFLKWMDGPEPSKTKTKVKLFGNINRDLEHLKLLILWMSPYSLNLSLAPIWARRQVLGFPVASNSSGTLVSRLVLTVPWNPQLEWISPWHRTL